MHYTVCVGKEQLKFPSLQHQECIKGKHRKPDSSFVASAQTLSSTYESWMGWDSSKGKDTSESLDLLHK